MRSKGAIGILIVLILVGLAGCYGCSARNGFVEADEEVSRAWADVENQYQRRADLVPRLVETVEAAADLERDLIVSVNQSREAALALLQAPESDQDLAEFNRLQGRLGDDLSKLITAAAAKPDLQAVEAHRDLLVQLEGTENRIALARKRYNDAVSDYNREVRTFPAGMFASLFGYEPKPAFTSERTSG